MNIIEMTRALGKQLQQEDSYKAYVKARDDNDNDTLLQEKIGEFNLKRMTLHTEMQKPDKDEARLGELDKEIKALYGEIMATPSMAAYNQAKESFDKLLSEINTVITFCANGEDPDTCPTEKSSCSGSCGSCSGCH